MTKPCSLCGISEGYLSECEDENRTLEWSLSEATKEVGRLRALLKRIREWDMLDATADGPYWRSEIDKVW